MITIHVYFFVILENAMKDSRIDSVMGVYKKSGQHLLLQLEKKGADKSPDGTEAT